jgi:hypothetical protein
MTRVKDKYVLELYDWVGRSHRYEFYKKDKAVEAAWLWLTKGGYMATVFSFAAKKIIFQEGQKS